jgi:PAS domain S-box-containing protein
MLSPPVFEDEIKTQQAYILHIILWTLIIVPIPYVLFILTNEPEFAPRALVQAAFGEITNIILLIILHRGYVRAASMIQVGAFWLFFTITALTGSGVQGVAYLIGYTMIITIAGILLGRTGAAIFTLLSLAAGAYMVNLQLQGKLPQTFSAAPFTIWIVSLVLFPFGAVLQYLASYRVRTALALARDSEERYRLISRVSSDYTFSTALDEDGNMHLSWVAGAFQEISGYTYEEYVANGGWAGHLHPHDIEKDAMDMETIRQNQKVITEVRTFTKNGEVHWVRVYAHPIWDVKQDRLTGIVGAVQDITDHKQVAEREASHQASLEKVLELGKLVTESGDLQATYERIWYAVRNELKFERLGIYLYDAEHNSINGAYGTNIQGEMIDESEKRISLNKDTDETRTFVKVLEDENGLYFTHQYDVDHDTVANPKMKGVKDYAAVAAWAGNKPVAVLCVDNAITQQPINEEQLESLRLFAGFAGLAIENSRLKDALQHELTQQKNTEEKEAGRRAMLEKVVALGKHVTEVADLRTTVERIWHAVHDDLEFDRLAIFLYNAEKNVMNDTFGTDNDGRMIDVWELSFPVYEDIGRATTFMRVLEKPDGFYFTHSYDETHDISPESDMFGVKDFAAVAAWAGDKPIAVICADHLITGRPMKEEQLEALRLFAGYAGMAIQNARLNEALQSELAQRQSFIDELEAKNAELERFTYTVSHDLKSPLVTITGFLGYLEQDALNGNMEMVKSSANRISGAARKMHILLDDLLELSRVGRLMSEAEDVSFDEIVNEAIDLVQGRLDVVDAIVESQRDYPVVHGDRVRLVEVLQNLIENAVKYSNPDVKPRIEIGTSNVSETGFATFYVRDNGIGIEKQYHNRIFGLFNKLNAQSEGSGIGLSLVKRIIEVHNGRIWLESEKNQGATFYFSLPTPPTKE